MQSEPVLVVSQIKGSEPRVGEMAQQMLVRLSMIEDPRAERGKRYPLTEMLFMAFVGVLCGGNDWESVQAFCEAQHAWFAQFLTMKHGVPTVRTFERVFEALNWKGVEGCLNDLLQALRQHSKGTKLKDKVIAIDGKTLRASFDKASEQNALHVLHAYGTDSGIVLGQAQVDAKENEIPAIPRLLETLEIQGRTVTTDAMGCQREVAENVTRKKGDYVLALKGNHPTLHQHVIQRFEFAERMNFDRTRMGEPFGHHHHGTVDKGHGRIEERTIDTLDAMGDWFHRKHPGWKSVKSVIRITSHRTLGMTTSTETRYYISSHPAEKDRLIASAIRAHWCVENNLHWCLDTVFNEDKSRIRKGHGPMNFAVFRRAVMSTLKKDKSKNKSLKVKRFLAALLPDYRMKLLGF